MITFDEIRELALNLPGVDDGTSYGTPALKVNGKLLARLKEDGASVVFRVPFDQRDLLMQTKPKVFFITDHYLGYPAVLMRLRAASSGQAADIIEMACRFVAPKRLFDARTASTR